MLKQIIIYFGFGLFVLTVTEAQAQRVLIKGKEAFADEQYYIAGVYFDKIINSNKYDDVSKGEAAYLAGRCYYEVSRPSEAIKYFKTALQYNYKGAELHLYYGQALQMIESFAKAEKHLLKYKEMMPSDTIAEQALEKYRRCIYMMRNPTRYEVVQVPSLNSPEMDYCPFFKGNTFETVYFTSSRRVSDKPPISPESGEYFSNIYEAENDKEGFWQKPNLVGGNVNTDFDEGAASLNRTTRNLYFTRCTYSRKKDKACRIYVAKKSSNLWMKVEEIEITGIPKHVSVGHPSISHDELTLFFVADSMFGGYGGKDIYKISRERRSENFGAPQNLGPDINTRYDDAYPYIRSNNTLYFSSKGHNSIGGYDIFITKQIGPAQYDVKTMGYPINSPHDDFGIVFMDSREEGFLTSERIGGLGKADIYYFNIPKIAVSLKGIVWDLMTNKPVEAVQVSLMNDENELVDIVKTNLKGEYSFIIEPNFKYTIFAKHKDYVISTESISTEGINRSKELIREIFIEKKQY
jgi:peptidoglycan-associated lipoprotein